MAMTGDSATLRGLLDFLDVDERYGDFSTTIC